MNYNILLISLILIGVIFFSGCILFSPTNYQTNDVNFDKNVDQAIINYQNQLASCDINDPCSTAYIDNNTCHYNIDSNCKDAKDNNALELKYKDKTFNCQQSLKTNSLINSCNQLNLTEKENCISDLTEKTNNLNCCYLLYDNYTQLKDTNYKSYLNKCEIDNIIKTDNYNNCINIDSKKECFVCYLRNTHTNVFTNNICQSFSGDNKQYCIASIFLDFKFCDNIIDETLKKNCQTTEINTNNCIYYNDNPKNIDNNKLYIANLNEFLNTTTRLEFFKRKDLNKENFIKYYKTEDNYKFSFDDSIDLNKILKPCTLDTKKHLINYSDKKYSTFYFDYMNYHFVYSIEMYKDFYDYSKELKNQYCYDFNTCDSYSRYLQDPYNNALLTKITNDFNGLKEYGFSDSEIFEIITRFVQEIPYNYNWGKENVYPYETLYTMQGVCLDKAIILAKLLSNLGYETYIATGIADYTASTLNHAVVGVTCNNSNLEYNNKKICLIESTHPYLINELEITNKLTFNKLSDGKEYTEANYGPTNVKRLKDLESKIDDQIKQINNSAENKDWNNYNKIVTNYNDNLYEILKIRFQTYQ